MKKMVLLVVLAVLSLSAQDMKFGVTGALNMATMNTTTDDAQDQKIADSFTNRTGFAIGGFANFSINEKFSIQPEILYMAKGTELDYSETQGANKLEATGYMKTNHLEIPVLGMFHVNKEFSILAGPYASFFLNGTQKMEGKVNGDAFGDSKEEDIDSDNVESTEFGLTFGAAYNLTGQFSVGARYSLGLTNIEAKGDDESKHRNFQLTVGYAF